ncbi:TRAP transporter substrate-binding protein [Telmatospirillum sp.]|uniref:TRAP transporter substrate-binding protein n=1 Tax=Telmatospirillum sp. TaxID=2079197 RepID=UPI00283F2F73|nr:TRAP transporter substrate-binding protein [Telmatospirillum sp.]MDR3437385.1 TRAP transporter substrate-binding protein [Telmatospirillum sp.]
MSNNPLSRRDFIRVASAASLVGATTIGGIRPSFAAPLTLRLASSFSNDPNFSAARVWYDKFAERLQANCGDEIVVKFFPDSQLGKESDIVSQLKLGVVDMMLAGSAIWATIAPEIGIFDLGYLFKDFAHQTRVLESDASKFLDKLLADRGGVRVLGWSYTLGARNFFTKFSFKSAEELGGKKIRSLPTPAMTETVRLMGASPTPLAFGEVYTALQTNVIDGLEHDAPTILTSKFYEAAKYLTLTRHSVIPLAPVIARRSFEKIPANLRDGFLAAADEANVFERQRALTIEAEAIVALQKQGVTVEECDREKFRERVRPLWQSFVDKLPATKPLLEAIVKAEG